jgi:hypothetical protein
MLMLSLGFVSVFYVMDGRWFLKYANVEQYFAPGILWIQSKLLGITDAGKSS